MSDSETSIVVVRREGSHGSDPIDNIVWLASRDLRDNAYNPNVVFGPELRLLEESILRTGWTQPIIVNDRRLIVDGFHRWRLSMDSPRIRDRWAEEVPCVVLEISDAEAMMLTIRINRAKGTHVALRLSHVIQELHNDLGVSRDEIMRGCGMGKEEVDLLLAGGLLKSRNLANYAYSKAWVPIETRRAEKVDGGFERSED